jgi:hypothetical protein
MNNSTRYSIATYPIELPRMANPFVRRTRDQRFQFLAVPGIDRTEVCFSSECFASIFSSVESS